MNIAKIFGKLYNSISSEFFNKIVLKPNKNYKKTLKNAINTKIIVL